MPAEYKTIEFVADASPASIDVSLNEQASDGWTVKAAYSPTHFLLERLPPAPIPRAEPRPPTGARR